MTGLSELAARVEAAEGPELFDWHGNPSWSQEGGEHFDGNWVPDCGSKTDYDPGLLRLSCRVWGDGDYICSVILGSDAEIETTGVLEAGDKDHAKAAVETWCAEKAAFYRDLVAAALRAHAAQGARP